ncbi:MAG: hypothetical protein P8L44_04200 [Opitutales bacterium]|nr:hypothetical protein [Opitutales bacterium]
MSPHVKAPEETRARILQVAMEKIHMQGFVCADRFSEVFLGGRLFL